jgi:hypothetical protein
MAIPVALSGMVGAVYAGGSKIAEVSEWKATTDQGIKTYGAQSGVVAGVNWEKNVLGTHKCTGSFNGYFDPNYPMGSIVNTDNLITLTLYKRYPDVYVTGQARIASHDDGANIGTGDPEPLAYNFNYFGAPTFEGF